MLLKEDGHLDIERIRQLNEEELEAEQENWSGKQWYEWFRKDGVMTHEEVFGYLRRRIKEIYAKRANETTKSDESEPAE